MVSGDGNQEVLRPSTTSEPGSERLGAGFLEREADCCAVRLLIADAEPRLLFVGEHLVEPVFSEAGDRAPYTLDEAEIDADAQDHRRSPERP